MALAMARAEDAGEEVRPASGRHGSPTAVNTGVTLHQWPEQKCISCRGLGIEVLLLGDKRGDK
jgi:hypothetical protein